MGNANKDAGLWYHNALFRRERDSDVRLHRATKREKLLQFAGRVWDVRDGSEDARIDAAIAATRNFYESLGLQTHLADYGVKPDTAAEVARRLGAKGMGKLGEHGDITPAVVEKILRLAA